jgi:hypothetical protein
MASHALTEIGGRRSLMDKLPYRTLADRDAPPRSSSYAWLRGPRGRVIRIGPAAADAAAGAAERTVFTDSAMHARQCEATPPGGDWRRVCVPLNQGAVVKRKP